MITVRFHPAGKEVRVAEGTSLWRAALEGGMPLASSCEGAGICRACRVRILEGMAHLSEPGDIERQAAEEAAFERNERLACLACPTGPVTITTTYW